jgi:hypothetical protein
MAKKKDKDRKQAEREPKSRTEQVRAAVEGAFEATAHGAGPVRERAQELADELAGAAARFREVLDELRPPTGDELRALGQRLDALERRVAELETGRAAAAVAPPAVTAAKPRPRRTTRATAEGAKGASASPGASTAKRATPARKPRSTGADEPSA